MILLKSKNCNIKHTEFYKMLKLYNEGNTNYIISCPYCNSNNLISHGYYKRNVIFEYNDTITSLEIKIKRVKCKGCGHTHALIPFIIIPYKQVILSIIINCLYNEDYFNSSPFSYDTKIKWLKQYKHFLPYIKTMFNNIKNIYDKIKENFSEFYYQFYKKTKRILFLIRHSKYNIGLL